MSSYSSLSRILSPFRVQTRFEENSLPNRYMAKITLFCYVLGTPVYSAIPVDIGNITKVDGLDVSLKKLNFGHIKKLIWPNNNKANELKLRKFVTPLDKDNQALKELNKKLYENIELSDELKSSYGTKLALFNRHFRKFASFVPEQEQLPIAIDESQSAIRKYEKMFPPSNPVDELRPFFVILLRTVLQLTTKKLCLILSGTGMSFDDIKNYTSSSIAKRNGPTFKDFFSIHDGFYEISVMSEYIKRFLPLDDESMESTFNIFRGRRRFVVQFLEESLLDNSSMSRDANKSVEGNMKKFNLHDFLDDPSTAFFMPEKEATADNLKANELLIIIDRSNSEHFFSNLNVLNAAKRVNKRVNNKEIDIEAPSNSISVKGLHLTRLYRLRQTLFQLKSKNQQKKKKKFNLFLLLLTTLAAAVASISQPICCDHVDCPPGYTCEHDDSPCSPRGYCSA
ncbi:hypothetical protein RhiirA4_528036 [Rhizophagus irregularis]|uniref:Uncharacterized protein n=1 Tax=Rhizophagus irregularis TaxID=588596 RepID=A0A2I1GSE9_9GLOM|nr:hypothetical protein RhiirA4_528036 [Rhizophagus irregularis]